MFWLWALPIALLLAWLLWVFFGSIRSNVEFGRSDEKGILKRDNSGGGVPPADAPPQGESP